MPDSISCSNGRGALQARQGYYIATGSAPRREKAGFSPKAVAGAMKSGAGEAGTAASLPAPITRRAGARWVRPMDQRQGPAPAAQADDPGGCQCPAPGAMGAAQWAGQSQARYAGHRAPAAGVAAAIVV